jgi:hypothetical protein
MTTSLTTTTTTVRLPDTFTYTTTELISCLIAPSACAYGSEGWEFESLRAHLVPGAFRYRAGGAARSLTTARVGEGWKSTGHSAPERRHLTTLGICAYTDTGVIGQPLRATKKSTRCASTSPPNLAGLPSGS